MVIKAVIPNMTLFTVYVVYFPSRREGLSILASAISFYLAFELNNLSEFLLIGVSLVFINEITITTVLFLECLLRLSSSLPCSLASSPPSFLHSLYFDRTGNGGWGITNGQLKNDILVSVHTIKNQLPLLKRCNGEPRN